MHTFLKCNFRSLNALPIHGIEPTLGFKKEPTRNQKSCYVACHAVRRLYWVRLGLVMGFSSMVEHQNKNLSQCVIHFCCMHYL